MTRVSVVHSICFLLVGGWKALLPCVSLQTSWNMPSAYVAINRLFRHPPPSSVSSSLSSSSSSSSTSHDSFLVRSYWKSNFPRNTFSDRSRFQLAETRQDTSADKYPIRQSWGKERMRRAYKLSSILFGCLAALIFLMPDKTLSKKIATKIGGAAGFGLAAGTNYILGGANEQDRLDRDTYKRLNVGILGFSILGLAGVPGEAAFFPTATPAILTSLFMFAIRIVGAIVAYQGWNRGILPTGSTPLQELLQGTKANFRGLRVKVANKKKSLAYRNCMLLVMFGMFSNFMGGIFDIRVSSSSR